MEKHANRKLFIEGESDPRIGDLRKGFRILLEKNFQLLGKMPQLIMGGGRDATIMKFKNEIKWNSNCLILLDLDAEESNKEAFLLERKIEKYSENVFFMIQEMESWFFSQPAILENYYGKSQLGKLPKTAPMLIEKPSEKLTNLTRNSSKNGYHKVKHGTDLLMKLDPIQLASDFTDFRNLIEKLR